MGVTAIVEKQKYLRVGSPQGISTTKFLEDTCGLAARRSFQAPNGWKVPGIWQSAGHFKQQMARKYLWVDRPQGICSTKWLESTCGSRARRAFETPNGLKVPVGRQPAGHLKHQMA